MGTTSTFQEGERITFAVRAAVDCHIAVFCHQIDGSTVVLFPNTHSNSTRVAKDKSVSMPGEDKDKFDIEITPPFGGDIVQVIACTRKSALTGIVKDAQPVAGSPYATLSRGLLARGMQPVGTGEGGVGQEQEALAKPHGSVTPRPPSWRSGADGCGSEAPVRRLLCRLRPTGISPVATQGVLHAHRKAKGEYGNQENRKRTDPWSSSFPAFRLFNIPEYNEFPIRGNPCHPW